MNMTGAFGAVLSPLMTPILLNYFDWPTIFAILAGGWFVAALAWLRIDASEKLEPEPPPEPDTHIRAADQTSDAIRRASPPEADSL